MNAQELMLEAMRTFHYGAKTSEEYALLTCLPVDTCDAILRSMPWYVGLNLYPPERKYWMLYGVEVPPDRKPVERETAEWQTLYDTGRMR